MKYSLFPCFFLLFLILLSCEEGGGGESPSSSQKSRTFSQVDEGFKEFLLAESKTKFADIGAGYNFGNEEQVCSTSSSITIDGVDKQLSSSNCFYYVNAEDDFEEFSLAGSLNIDQSLRLYVYISFANGGIPQTGTYFQEFYCIESQYYCYYNVALSAFVVDEQNQIVQFFEGEYPMVEVINQNDVVTASFEDVTFYYNDYYFEYPVIPNFTASGTLSCCN